MAVFGDSFVLFGGVIFFKRNGFGLQEATQNRLCIHMLSFRMMNTLAWLVELEANAAHS